MGDYSLILNQTMMEKKNRIVVSKKGNKYVVTDLNTGKRLYQVEDKPVYDAFNLENSFLFGMGSSINFAGNYFSFKKYRETNDDEYAITSDWEKIGVYLLNALMTLKYKL